MFVVFECVFVFECVISNAPCMLSCSVCTSLCLDKKSKKFEISKSLSCRATHHSTLAHNTGISIFRLQCAESHPHVSFQLVTL